MQERTTVRLPRELLRRAKRKAASEGRTLTALIEEGLRSVISSEGRDAKRKGPMPRISGATGGTLPAIDLDDLSALQEREDQEAVDRMKRLT